MGVLNDNIVGGAAGVSTGQETYAPSSNDWDYTYDGSEDWTAAGNTLGDDSGGGFIECVNHADSGIYSLFTFDGDFEIAFTITAFGGSDLLAFGVHEITEDNNRGTDDGRSLYGSGIESFMWWDGSPGGGANKFWNGNTNDGSGSHTYSDGDAVKITRESGTIKFYDGASVAHTFSATSTNPVRFFFASAGGSGHNIDNILLTDSEGVQRDGFINEDTSAYPSFGDRHVNEKCIGARRRATRTGNVASVKFNVQAAGIASSAVHCEVWSDNGGSPGSQIGSDSASITVDSTGIKTFTFSGTGPEVAGGKVYWYVFVDGGNGDLNIFVHADAAHAGLGSGKHDTITSIVDNVTGEYSIEVQIETTEEPTPDWHTLLLIHSDTSDGSTTFVDSSPYGRTPTLSGDVHHDTAQKKFGASSIYFDGTGDRITFPDSLDWLMRDTFTIECWARFATVGQKAALINQQSGSGNANQNFRFGMESSNKFNGGLGNNGDSGSENATSSASISADTWYHFAFVKTQGHGGDAGTIKMFIDGSVDGTATGDMNGTNIASVLSIGLSNDTADLPFHGWMDEIRISKVARWDANFTPPTSPYP